MDLIPTKHIENSIFTLRGLQVMLDSDLAVFYDTETKYINRAIKRNPGRFPETCVFQLSVEEWNSIRFQSGTLKSDGDLKFQNDTLKTGRGQHKKYLPFVFTEQGVAMLSAVLHSETAIQVSLQIMQAFVKMRSFLLQNASVFQRIESLEIKQLKTDDKIEQIFKVIDAGQLQPQKGIFFDGQIFDAYAFVCDLIKKATNEIILIDNYVDESVLTLMTKRQKDVSLVIYSKTISKTFQLDAEKHQAQYPPVEIKSFANSHDRFLLIDGKELYHLGASLKDLGKKWFAFSKMDKNITTLILEQLKK